MPNPANSKRIFLAPAPRAVADIFDENSLSRLRAAGELVVQEDGPVTDALFDAKAAQAEIIIGQSGNLTYDIERYGGRCR